MKEIIIKFILILLIIIINFILAYTGEIYHLIQLTGIYLMLRIWRQINDLL